MYMHMYVYIFIYKFIYIYIYIYITNIDGMVVWNIHGYLYMVDNYICGYLNWRKGDTTKVKELQGSC